MDSISEPTLSLAEFAHQVRKSERSIRRYLKQGRFVAYETEGGTRVPVSQVAVWRKSEFRLGLQSESLNYGTDLPGVMPNTCQALSDEMPERTSPLPGTLQALIDGLPGVPGTMPGKSQTVTNDLPGAVPVDVHRLALAHSAVLLEKLSQAQEALEKARQAEQRAERRAAQLEGQLGTTVRMLSESAQSLTEQRAMAMMAEARRAEAADLAERLANAAQLVDHQADPKIDVSRQSRGWGSSLKRLLFRKIG